MVFMQKMSKDTFDHLNYYLEEAIQNDKADMGNIQVFDAETDILQIIAQRGFKTHFLEYFRVVKAFDTSACGRAIGLKNPIVIGDVMQDIAFIPHRSIAISAGFRAVKSVPIFSTDQKLLGVISTHYETPKWTWDPNALVDVVKSLSELLQQQVARSY